MNAGLAPHDKKIIGYILHTLGHSIVEESTLNPNFFKATVCADCAVILTTRNVDEWYEMITQEFNDEIPNKFKGLLTLEFGSLQPNHNWKEKYTSYIARVLRLVPSHRLLHINLTNTISPRALWEQVCTFLQHSLSDCPVDQPLLYLSSSDETTSGLIGSASRRRLLADIHTTSTTNIKSLQTHAPNCSVGNDQYCRNDSDCASDCTNYCAHNSCCEPIPVLIDPCPNFGGCYANVCVPCIHNNTCQDNLYCNGQEICSSSGCIQGTPISCPNGTVCSERLKRCAVPCTNNSTCDDGLFCNGQELCIGGFCQAGSLPCHELHCLESHKNCSANFDLICPVLDQEFHQSQTVSLGRYFGCLIAPHRGVMCFPLINSQSPNWTRLQDSGVLRPPAMVLYAALTVTVGDFVACITDTSKKPLCWGEVSALGSFYSTLINLANVTHIILSNTFCGAIGSNLQLTHSSPATPSPTPGFRVAMRDGPLLRIWCSLGDEISPYQLRCRSENVPETQSITSYTGYNIFPLSFTDYADLTMSTSTDFVTIICILSRTQVVRCVAWIYPATTTFQWFTLNQTYSHYRCGVNNTCCGILHPSGTLYCTVWRPRANYRFTISQWSPTQSLEKKYAFLVSRQYANASTDVAFCAVDFSGNMDCFTSILLSQASPTQLYVPLQLFVDPHRPVICFLFTTSIRCDENKNSLYSRNGRYLNLRMSYFYPLPNNTLIDRIAQTGVLNEDFGLCFLDHLKLLQCYHVLPKSNGLGSASSLSQSPWLQFAMVQTQTGYIKSCGVTLNGSAVCSLANASTGIFHNITFSRPSPNLVAIGPDYVCLLYDQSPITNLSKVFCDYFDWDSNIRNPAVELLPKNLEVSTICLTARTGVGLRYNSAIFWGDQRDWFYSVFSGSYKAIACNDDRFCMLSMDGILECSSYGEPWVISAPPLRTLNGIGKYMFGDPQYTVGVYLYDMAVGITELGDAWTQLWVLDVDLGRSVQDVYSTRVALPFTPYFLQYEPRFSELQTPNLGSVMTVGQFSNTYSLDFISYGYRSNNLTFLALKRCRGDVVTPIPSLNVDYWLENYQGGLRFLGLNMTISQLIFAQSRGIVFDRCLIDMSTGSLQIINTEATFSNCVFYNPTRAIACNSLIFDGSVINIRSTNVSDLNGSTCNTAPIQFIDSKVNYTQGTIRGMTGGKDGIMSSVSSEMTLSQINVEDSRAPLSGLIQSFADKSYGFSVNCRNNIAKEGGCFNFLASRGVSVTGSFTNNTAYKGAAIFSNRAVISLSLCTFINCTTLASSDAVGGVVWLENMDNVDSVAMSSCIFDSNTLVGSGPVTIFGGVLSLSSITCQNNKATLGGCLYSRNGRFNINSGRFFNNTADYGGAVFALYSDSNVWSDSSAITYSTIQNNSYFNNNIANIYGGTVFTSRSPLQVLHRTSTNFSGNAVQGGGGLWYWEGLNVSSTIDLNGLGYSQTGTSEPMAMILVNSTNWVLDANQSQQVDVLFTPPLHVYLVDGYQRVVIPPSLALTVTTTLMNQTGELRGTTKTIINNTDGLFRISDPAIPSSLRLAAPPSLVSPYILAIDYSWTQQNGRVNTFTQLVSVYLQNCSTGYYYSENNKACLPCQAGYRAFATNCTACSPGYFSSEKAINCLPCPRGSFSGSEASASCQVCPAGAVSAEDGATACVSCEAGFYQNNTNSSSCIACLPGFFQGQPNQRACLPCVTGRYSDVSNSTDCITCPAGKYQPLSNATLCLLCDKGYFQNYPGQGSCERCLEGYFQNETTQASCVACPAGTFQNVTTQSFCYTCLPGFYQGLPSQTTCLSCVPGQYSNASASILCNECPAGTFQPSNSAQTCLACLVGTIQPLAGQSRCVGCGAGQFVNASQQCEECPQGTFQFNNSATSCISCPPGFYQSFSGQSSCLSCISGRFSDKNGSSDCSPCTTGTFQPNTTSTTCGNCSAGFYQGSTAQTNCLSCTTGRYTNISRSEQCLECQAGTAESSINSTQCAVCLAGFYQPQTGQSRCLECNAGRFSNATNSIQCMACPEGRYQAAENATVCVECPPGFIQSQTGQMQCVQCSAGRFSNTSGSISCRSCPSGRYQQHENATACVTCVAGTFQASSGQSSCVNCPAGRYDDRNGTSSECIECPIGKYQPNASATYCLLCEEGYYQGLTGQLICIACGVGQYSNTTASTECMGCPEGTFQNKPVANQCSACPAGFYQGLNSQSSCVACSVGSYTNTSQSIECSSCPEGHFQNRTAAIGCFECPLGLYQDQPGQPLCLSCPSGTYAPGRNHTKCIDCPIGRAQNVTASLECLPCPYGSYWDRQGGAFCAECPPGKRGRQAENARDNCDACPAGTSQSASGATVCEPCVPGKFSPATTSSVCCPEGRFNNATNQISCEVCPPGSYQSLPGQTECLLCNPGSFSSNNSFLMCLPCDAGKFTRSSGATICDTCRANSQAKIDRCICQKGFYTIDDTYYIPECYDCPVGAVCDEEGMTVISLKSAAGYWRDPTRLNSTEFLKCVSASACVGGPNGSQCATHRKQDGPLCGVCEEGYQESFSSCRLCLRPSASIGITILFTIILIVLLIFIFYLIIRSRPIDQKQNTLRNKFHKSQIMFRMLQASEGESISLQHSDLYDMSVLPTPLFNIKILVSFFQLAWACSELTSVPVPTAFRIFMNYIDAFVNLSFIPWQAVECAAGVDFYTKLIVVTVLPFFLAIIPIVCLLSWMVMDFTDYRDGRNQERRLMIYRERLARIVLFTLFLIYPAVSSRVLSFFTCQTIGSGQYLTADLRIACGVNDDRWMRYLRYAVVMLVIYPIGIPLAFFTLVYRVRHQLHLPHIQMRLGFLYEAYDKRKWWFELVDLLHKLFITAVVRLLPSKLQVPFDMGVIAAFVAVILTSSPYIRSYDDRMHIACEIAIFMLVFASYVWDNEGNLSTIIDHLLSVFVFLILILMVLLFVYHILFYLKKRVQYVRLRSISETMEGGELGDIDARGCESATGSVVGVEADAAAEELDTNDQSMRSGDPS